MQITQFDPHFLDQLISLSQLSHYDPHQILGIHPFFDDSQVIHLWRPGASRVYLEVLGSIIEAKSIHQSGLFEAIVSKSVTYNDYRVYHQNGLLAHDPYSFTPVFGELDQYLFSNGVHYELYKHMGGRLKTHMGVKGANFTVWAPNARTVSLVGDFNHWDGRVNPMRVLGHSGIWELFVPGIGEGCKYKFEIHSQQGVTLLKSDPYALASELRPATASVLANIDRFQWKDQSWIEQRNARKGGSYPINIYEVHLGSWRQKDGQFLNYRELAHQLVEYCKEMGFTHIELLPIKEHPLDESWGYQVSGFYAPTSRFGTPEDFQYFVNHFHQNQIGVILDWVPGHFPVDEFSLGLFDGSALYEHTDPRQGFHPHWGTYIFNFGRHEVSNFLIANALYWLSEMHLDGLRVDAVASLLYLDYGRDDGGWIPNLYGGKENLQAIEFLKHFNSIVHERCPGVLTIAEESTSFTGVSHPLEKGGLGFDMKWNMGWMNDTLRYFAVDPLFRVYHQNDLTFGLIYAFTERFILVLSHDEVVHGKKNVLSKMPGDYWQKFANLRLLISYMICQPGKKLLFMGIEIGQWNEWYCKKELEWSLLNFPAHQGIKCLVKEINHFYLSHAALWERDFDHTTFEWVNFADHENSIICYLRKSSNETLLCVHNFTPMYHPEYIIHLGGINDLHEVFNSDDEQFWGSGKHNFAPAVLRDNQGRSWGARLSLAPLATMIFSVH